MPSVKSYFDEYSHHHAYDRDPSSYSQILENIKQILTSDDLNILDLGCGDGSFFKSLEKSGIKGKFYGVDLSQSMISSALVNLSNIHADLLVGDGLNLSFREDLKFDVIHLDCVLHHLISANRRGSKELSRRLLSLLHGRLSQHGMIIVEEMYYDSFLFSEFTSMIVFYGLKFINLFHLNINWLRGEFQPGLEVNFFSDKGLERLFQVVSEKTREVKRTKTRVPKFYRLFLLKEFGRVSYIVYY